MSSLRERRRRQLLRKRLEGAGDFDDAWYSKRYPDIAASGRDSFDHYIEDGWKEGRFANPLFDSGFYLNQNSDVRAVGVNPLVHYVDHGASEGRDPNPWFDTALYRKRVGATLSQTPVAHYLRQAPRDRIFPTENFDLALLRGQLSEISNDADPYCELLGHPQAVRHGWLGDCTSIYAVGWACRTIGPAVSLVIRVNGVEQGVVRPWLPRSDVVAHGFSLISGFFFSFPQRLRPGDVVEALDERGEQLLGSPRVYVVSPLAPEIGFTAARAAIAHSLLRGRGLEIGAFTTPTDVPADAVMSYYDRFPLDLLRKHYDETWGRPLVAPKYHGEAQTLEGLPDGETFDFVIANHVIEHLEDPILFLKSLSRFVRPGGRVMLAAPNKRFTFDAGRELTPFDHLTRDHREGVAGSRKAHYLDWAERVEGLAGAKAARRAEALDQEDLAIHFHVWNEATFCAFLSSSIEAFQLPFVSLLSFNNNREIIVVLDRIDGR